MGILSLVGPRALFFVLLKSVDDKWTYIRTGSCQKAGPPNHQYAVVTSQVPPTFCYWAVETSKLAHLHSSVPTPRWATPRPPGYACVSAPACMLFNMFLCISGFLLLVKLFTAKTAFWAIWGLFEILHTAPDSGVELFQNFQCINHSIPALQQSIKFGSKQDVCICPHMASAHGGPPAPSTYKPNYLCHIPSLTNMGPGHEQ